MTRVWEVALSDTSQVAGAIRSAVEAAREAGLPDRRVDDTALVASELATNAVRYARDGRLVVELAQDDSGTVRGVQIVALDHGPGIADLDRALEDGYSTGGTLGAGLGACKRVSDVFEGHSAPGRGTVLLARLSARADRGALAGAATVGAVHLALGGARDSGDRFAHRGRAGRAPRRVAALSDGLGHGTAAARASDLAARVLHREPERGPEELLRAMHSGLRGSRGAAVTLAVAEEASGTLLVSGIGNVSARLLHAGEWETLPARPGIVGAYGMRTPHVQRRRWTPGDLLLLHTDGMPARWHPPRMHGSADRDAALVAAVLLRDSSSAALPLRDDTAVAVMAHSGGDRGGRA